MRADFINTTTLRNDIEIFQFEPGDKASFGTNGVSITSVQLLNQEKKPLSWVVGGEPVSLRISCLAHVELSRPIIGFQFKDRLGQVIFADNTYLTYKDSPPRILVDQTMTAMFQFVLPVLPAGDYSIAVAVADGTQDTHVQHQWIHDAMMIRVHASSICFGLIGVPMQNISLGQA